MVKTGDFKTSSKGVVQVEAGKGSDESDAPSDDNDVEKFVDFVGVQELNVSESDDDPKFEDNLFGFFGINFGEVGKISAPKASTKDNSRSIGVALTDMKSRGNKRSTLDWWNLYLDSCASYHTFFVKELLMKIYEGAGAINGNCNAGTTRITKRGYCRKLRVWLNEKGITNVISIPTL